jgi:hypothetical protein
MVKYRIFMVGFGGTLHCPFNLGFTDLTDSPEYFDGIEEAAKFIREHVTEQNHDYVILPVVSL